MASFVVVSKQIIYHILPKFLVGQKIVDFFSLSYSSPLLFGLIHYIGIKLVHIIINIHIHKYIGGHIKIGLIYIGGLTYEESNIDCEHKIRINYERVI